MVLSYWWVEEQGGAGEGEGEEKDVKLEETEESN